MFWRLLCSIVILTMAAEAQAKKGLPAALRPRLDPTTLPTVPSACVDGRAGWRALKGDGREALVVALNSFPWKDRHYRAPVDCQLTVEILCAPDLDGDEQSDFLTRVRWRQPKAECSDDGVRHEAVLVAKRAKQWQLIDVVSHTTAASGRLAEARVAFVQLPDGKIGLTCKTQTEKTGSGCKVLGYWVGAVVGGRVEKLGEADPEFCQPD